MVAITEAVSLEKQGEIALLWIDNPPVNALGHPVRKGMADGITMAMNDDEIKAIVVICKGRTFCAGADIREFGKPPLEPHLPDVLNTFDQCTKPIIAAIHGTAFGGGLETALSSHFRVAVPSAQFGLPEVKLGLLPGAGGTQRLPRLIGPEKALPMVATGNPIRADKALKEGVIDEIVEGDLAEGAIAFAKKALAEKRPMRRVSAMTEKIDEARNKPEIFADYRKQLAKTARGFEAPEACVKAVETAVHKPFAEGLKYERELFQQLMSGSQSAAQRYYFFAEREVAKIPDIPKDTPLIDIKKVGIIGAGTMGGGITMNFVNAGIPVTLVEAKHEFLERGLGVIKKNYDISAAKGKMTADDVNTRMGLIKGTTSMEDLADVDLVIEAVFENMDLKKEIFSKLDAICKPGAILATNTSYLNVDEIAAMTQRPEYVLGLHFFSPANVMRLLEVVRAAKTSIPVLATAMAIAKKIKKIAVMVGVCHGFAGNRMFSQRRRESEKLILEGALPAQVDKVVYEFGFPMGPFQLYDLIGNDLGWSKETSKGESIRDLICEQGRFGLKASKGYYNYDPGSRVPKPAPEVDQLIVEFSEKKGYKRREISDEEILQRCIYPIINEGAKILEEKIAVRPSDLDVIWINGYGWPLYRGGPMFYADLAGLDKVLAVMKKFQAEHGDDFKPAALLEKLVKEGKKFASLN